MSCDVLQGSWMNPLFALAALPFVLAAFWAGYLFRGLRDVGAQGAASLTGVTK